MTTATPPAALADGDPASDVLAAQPLFLPQDAGAQASTARRLQAALSTRPGHGALRVAVIASAADLGSVSALWRRPAAYARFLGQEIALLYRGEVLVVMPDGYGLARGGRAPPGRDAALVARLPVPGRATGSAALAAVIQLRAAHGVTVSQAGAVPAGRSAGATGILTWGGFALGAVVIAAVWAYSLRARPPSIRRV